MAVGWTMVAAGAAASLLPDPVSQVGVDNDGKDIHILAYFLFMVWLAQLYPSNAGRVTIAVGLVLMGTGLEGLQTVQENRAGNWVDAAANGIGVGLGWLALGTRLGRSVEWLDRRMAKFLSR